jgi:hypothetical protein
MKTFLDQNSYVHGRRPYVLVRKIEGFNFRKAGHHVAWALFKVSDVLLSSFFRFSFSDRAMVFLALGCILQTISNKKLHIYIHMLYKLVSHWIYEFHYPDVMG